MNKICRKMKKIKFLLMLIFSFLFVQSIFANEMDDKEEDEFLEAMAHEISDEVFGNMVDDYTISVGVEFVHNDEKNRLYYFYVVDPTMYQRVNNSESKQILKNETLNNIKHLLNTPNKDQSIGWAIILSNLIENNSELVYSYCEKRNCFTIVFSVKELKEIIVGK